MFKLVLIPTWIIAIICICLKPFSFITISSLFCAITFSMRPMGTYIKADKILVMDCIMLFLYVMVTLAFKTFNPKFIALIALLRVLALCLVWYDDVTYVYITKEVEVDVTSDNN